MKWYNAMLILKLKESCLRLTGYSREQNMILRCSEKQVSAKVLRIILVLCQGENPAQLRIHCLIIFLMTSFCSLMNRMLCFRRSKIGQKIFVSATPGQFEKESSLRIAEQVIRPTGLLDPEISVRPIEGQIDDLVSEINIRAGRGERTLVTTLTKKMAEDLTDYFENLSIKVRYMHYDVDTIERMEIIRDLRMGEFDVLVGINLLREGLDIPEVSLVAILDADKEGFLRSETSLIQTIGRAARNANGQVIMYADFVTPSMERAINETYRRREKQMKYNEDNGIIPTTIKKDVRDVIEISSKNTKSSTSSKYMSRKEREELIERLTREMKAAAKILEFEHAAALRDRIEKIRQGK